MFVSRNLSNVAKKSFKCSQKQFWGTLSYLPGVAMFEQECDETAGTPKNLTPEIVNEHRENPEQTTCQ